MKLVKLILLGIIIFLLNKNVKSQAYYYWEIENPYCISIPLVSEPFFSEIQEMKDIKQYYSLVLLLNEKFNKNIPFLSGYKSFHTQLCWQYKGFTQKTLKGPFRTMKAAKNQMNEYLKFVFSKNGVKLPSKAQLKNQIIIFTSEEKIKMNEIKKNLEDYEKIKMYDKN